MEEEKFYVYLYLDPRKPGEYVYGEYTFEFEPFYVGKGSGDRTIEHIYEAKNYRDKKDGNKYGSPKCNKIRKIRKELNRDPIILKVAEKLDEEVAFTLETTIIKLIGRMNLRVGPLTNYTDGGNGVRNYVFTEERRKRMSEIGFEVQNRPEVKEKNRQAQLKRFKDPKERVKCSEYQREIQNRPEVKAFKREWIKNNNPRNFPGAEEKRKASLKVYYENHPEKAKEKADRLRKLANDPVNRKKNIDRLKALWKDPQYRENMSKVSRNQNWSDESRERMRVINTGKTHSEETKQKIRDIQKLPHVIEAKRKAATGNKNCCKKYIIIKPDNTEIECNDLKTFCTENNLKLSTMHGIANGHRKCTAKGFRCYKEGERGKMKNLWKEFSIVEDKYLITDPNGKEFKTGELPRFCKDYNLSYGGMIKVLTGRQRTNRGWIIKKI